MSNIHLIQFSTENKLNCEYVNISKLLCEKYCELHNFNYEFKIINNINNCNDILFKKLYIIYDKLKSLNENDYLVYLDTDAFINLPNFDLTTFFEDKYQMYFSVDWIHELNKQVLSNVSKLFNTKYNDKISIYTFLKSNKFCTSDYFYFLSEAMRNPYGINTGFMIIQKNEKTLEFFEDCIAFSKLKHIDHIMCTSDQSIIAYLLLNKYYFDTFNILPKFTQNHPVIPVETGLHFDINKSFLLHLYGQSENNRNIGAKLILNKWKQLKLIKD